MAPLVVLGAAAGCSLLLVPLPVRALAAQGVLVAMGVAGVALVLADSRRRRRRADAEEGGLPPAPPSPVLHRASARRLAAVLVGLLATAACVLVASDPAGAPFGVVAGLTYLVVPLLVALRRRRRLAAARAGEPGAAVVLVAPVDLATMRLAQWAKVTRTVLPAVLGASWLVVADADGVGLRSTSRTDRPLPRWGWDDVELARGPHPDLPDSSRAAVLVLTLVGPEPAVRARAVPLRRRRFEVALAVLHGAWTSTPEAVDAALADLLARRPGADGPSGVDGPPAPGADAPAAAEGGA